MSLLIRTEIPISAAQDIFWKKDFLHRYERFPEVCKAFASNQLCSCAVTVLRGDRIHGSGSRIQCHEGLTVPSGHEHDTGT